MEQCGGPQEATNEKRARHPNGTRGTDPDHRTRQETMPSLISWFSSTSGWTRSPYGELPRLEVDDSSVHQTWLILAGGLALILSRASRSELESRFAAARKVYAIAYARLKKRKLPKPDPRLLRDALKEIANLADPMTKEAGRECLERALERAAPQARGSVTSSSGSTHSQASSRAPLNTRAPSAAVPLTPTPPQAKEAEEEHPATQLDLDLLFERSNRLRGAVAEARSTTFGPDN